MTFGLRLFQSISILLSDNCCSEVEGGVYSFQFSTKIKLQIHPGNMLRLFGFLSEEGNMGATVAVFGKQHEVSNW